ncbi:MAG: glycine cleavage system aminomethyltransferase GcvT [Rhodospirillales bacterium]|nr:glycine cleavage system aminomethyltransferase GcvT [Rhodospirillales bacterium]
MSEQSTQPLKRTPLHPLHREMGAKLVPFAGYDMPVQYEGILAEHLHTRKHAGLFDVSHMGQARLKGADAIAVLESLVPGDIEALQPGQMRYTQFTNDAGGILDDLIVTRYEDHLFLVVNASRKEHDFAHIQANAKGDCKLTPLPDQALMALQGPKAAEVLGNLCPPVLEMAFMSSLAAEISGNPVIVSRSGYTGEDGYEISIAASQAEALARILLDAPEVKPVGLGARDSLRLEAGLCLYGNDIDETTTPIEAGLLWSISKRRRTEGGFAGAGVLQRQIEGGVARKRVGILPDGKAPARAHTEITDPDGKIIGEITSGGYGPTVGGPVAMGYVKTAYAAVDTPVGLLVRGKILPGKIVKMPFVQQHYYKG